MAMSLCFFEAFRRKHHGDITKQEYIKSLMAHFRGVRHPADHPDAVDEMMNVWHSDAFGDLIRDIALKTEYEPLDDDIKRQYPWLELSQAATTLAAYEQQPRIFKYYLRNGAVLDQSVDKAMSGPTGWAAATPGEQPIPGRERSISFLDALYEIDWEGIRSSRKKLGRQLSFRDSPEVIAWFFDHGAEIGHAFIERMSDFSIPVATIRDFLERTDVSLFKYSNVLQCAAGRGETDVVQLLLDAGADIDEAGSGRDEREGGPCAAIAEAVKGNHIQTTKLLLDRGVNTEPLHYRRSADAPRTLAGRQKGKMKALLSMYRVYD